MVNESFILKVICDIIIFLNILKNTVFMSVRCVSREKFNALIQTIKDGKSLEERIERLRDTTLAMQREGTQISSDIRRLHQITLVDLEEVARIERCDLDTYNPVFAEDSLLKRLSWRSKYLEGQAKWAENIGAAAGEYFLPEITELLKVKPTRREIPEWEELFSGRALLTINARGPLSIPQRVQSLSTHIDVLEHITKIPEQLKGEIDADHLETTKLSEEFERCRKEWRETVKDL